MVQLYKLADFIPEGGLFHFAKSTFSGRVPLTPHTHDFSEIFWVTKGSGIHMCNGNATPLTQGDLVVVNPEDQHAFQTIPGKTWTIANLACDSTILDLLLTKLPPASRPVLNQQIILGAEQLVELEEQVKQLLEHPQTQFSLERFLSNLLFMLIPSQTEPDNRDLPEWLRTALKELRRQETLQQGLAAFVLKCARSQEHVTRECRKYLGKTPTEIINHARLNYAEIQLISTDKSIKEICWECGFKSSAYFHKLFKTEFDQSPLLYRKNQQSIFTP